MTQDRETPPRHYAPALTRACLRPRYWPTWLLVAVLRACAALPLRASRRLGAALGWLLYRLNAKRRRIAHINVDLCFPGLAAGERDALVRRHYRVASQAYLDVGFLIWASERRLRRHTRVTGAGHYRAALAQGRPVILLAPHCVGLNFGGTVLSAWHPTFSMVKAQGDPVLNWLLTRARARYDAYLLERRQGLRPVIRGLRQGRSFYYLPDEDFGPEQSVFVPFFGIPTATLTTLGRLARATQALVVPCFTRVLPGGGGVEVVLGPAMADFPSGDEVADAARMNQVIEAGIREMPEQYLWTFKLFKTRPGNAPSPYDL